MGGDYTRFTFDPERAYNAVLRQQGRVGMDADHNEAAGIGDRRWRSGTLDVFGDFSGRCVVPSTTPDAFLITPTGPGTFTIGAGRAYVDGIQVENFGDPQDDPEWDPVLAEPRRTDPVAWDEQPFLPEAPEITPVADGDSHLVYLDVWYREIDHLADPRIRDLALGGPDSATRLQTVWQVRALALDDGEVGCDAEIAAWTDLIEPSAGRLTTATEAPTPEENPCLLSPEGGYRGPENRLYRVEIHAVAEDGTAGLKWSRDNASVRAGVEALAGNEVTVSSLGRDSILRFRVDDCVEIRDEHSDLDVGRSGEMARVTEIREAERILVLDRDLEATGLFDPTDEERRTRVVRWDHGDAADPATGVIAVPATLPPGGLEVVIEDGIRVVLELDPTDGRFRFGDYWLFAARTADSSVETLEKSAPFGTHHHYARLAVVTWPTTVDDDCREPWPPEVVEAGEGCCTVVVHPGEDVQAAIDSLPAEGGCVCLKAGEHRVDAAVVIHGPDVHLHGESPGAALIRSRAVPVLEVLGAPRLRVESVDLVVEELPPVEDAGDIGDTPPDHAILRLISASDVRFGGVEILARTGTSFAWLSGTFLRGCTDVRFTNCRFDGVPVGVMAASGKGLVIEASELRSQSYTEFLTRWGAWGVFTLMPETVVADNRFVDFETAVHAGESALDCRVEYNRIQRDPEARWSAGDEAKAYAVEVLATDGVVSDNVIEVPHESLGGIRLAAATGAIERNRIASSSSHQEEFPIGVLVEGPWAVLFHGEAPESFELPEKDRVLVADNRILGPQDAIVVIGAGGTVVRGNHLESRSESREISGIQLLLAWDAVVSNNTVRGYGFGIFAMVGLKTRLEGNHVVDVDAGTGGFFLFDPVSSGNLIERAKYFGCGVFIAMGASLFAHDRVVGCGWGPTPLFGAGLGLGVVFGQRVDVDGCQVFDSGISPEGDKRPAEAVVGILLGGIRRSRVEGSTVSFRNLETLVAEDGVYPEDRALVAFGFPEHLSDVSARSIGGTIQVSDNQFTGPGRAALVDLGRYLGKSLTEEPIRLPFEKISFSNNHCLHLAGRKDDQLATVWILAAHQIVMGNHVKSTVDGTSAADFFSVDFNGNQQVALVGNMTTGKFLNLGGSVPSPPESFNVLL